MHDIPIFCISLTRAQERRQFISKHWINNLKLDINFWEAYDRRNIENNISIYNYNPETTKSILGRYLSHGEIACITSYAMLYSFLIKNNYSDIIVMEDDILPRFSNKYQLYENIKAGNEEFNDTELMILHTVRKTQKYQILIKKTFFSIYDIIPWGNMFLYLNNTAIHKLYNELIKFSGPADMPQRKLYKQGLLNTIVINNGLCVHNTNTSYIENDYRFNNKNIRQFIP